MQINELGLIGVLCLACAPAGAQTSCDFTTPGGTLLDFPTYIPGQATPGLTTGQVQVDCENPTSPTFSYTLFIDGGLSGDVFSRRLFGPGGSLVYDIQDLLGQTVGNGEPGTTGITQTCLLLGVCLSIFDVRGVMAAGQIVPGGSYSDTVTVTIEF